ncbi:MAG: hypothetical protein NT015_01195 [Alphaproteobacteria bacterium]|nr:hypothetical protein [Alphaproteobacteria bacterium]
MRALLRILPYAIMGAYIAVFWWSFISKGTIVELASRAPNALTSETWRVLLRGGTNLYLTPPQWALFNAPFLLAPFAAVAGFFIWRELWQSGFYDRQR